MAKTHIRSKFTTLRKSISYKVVSKRCLIGLQKGVSKGLKGRLLQAKRASSASQKSMYSKS